jgi:hypothetical protein
MLRFFRQIFDRRGYFQLGSKFGTWLLERQLTPKYGYMGTIEEGV